MRKNVILVFLILGLFFKVSFGQEQLNNDLLSPEEKDFYPLVVYWSTLHEIVHKTGIG